MGNTGDPTMSATRSYIELLDAHATRLRTVNARMAEGMLAAAERGDRDTVRATVEAMRLNGAEAERYQAQASWHRHDNGETVLVRPMVKPWSD
ncbi:hypothetical protein SEA_HOONTER_132 [Mycobacterium phage Hoonter]|nr:hypothetical protein SEA_HOONTER_132 [Mycobacterium phage Hoonter]